MTHRVSTFGQTAQGATVHRVTLSNDVLTASFLTLGCTLQDLRLQGVGHSLTLGSPDISAYDSALAYCGAIVGPVANRIGGATAIIDGQPYSFDANQTGKHTLHGGTKGTHALLWTLADHGPSHAHMTLNLRDGLQGFPGNRTLTATYEVSGSTLLLTLTATTDAPTLMNLANHSYWRLDDAATTEGQILRIDADHYLPTDADLLPTGQIAPVSGTNVDYRYGRPLQGGAEGPLDTNFCLSNQSRPLQNVACLTARSGRTLDMATTAPGLQVYDGHGLDLPDVRDSEGAPIRPYCSLALEAQHWPDAPHNPNFPDITLRPGQIWQQMTTWTFSQ